MLTQCPHCATVFRLNAAALRAARGRVRCGHCSAAFDALARLVDEPALPVLAAAVSSPAQEAERRPPPQPSAAIPQDRSARAKPAARFVNGNPAALDLELRGTRPRPARRSTLLWGVAAVVLCAGLVLQGLWYERYRLLEHYPGLQHGYAGACRYLGCEAPRLRRLDALEIAARDVREHPRFQDSLLVNATLINRAPFAQSFPRLLLILYDVIGTAVAARSFTPGEYLDGSIDLSAGMIPDVPVHIVLELRAANAQAVGFEFKFL